MSIRDTFQQDAVGMEILSEFMKSRLFSHGTHSGWSWFSKTNPERLQNSSNQSKRIQENWKKFHETKINEAFQRIRELFPINHHSHVHAFFISGKAAVHQMRTNKKNYSKRQKKLGVHDQIPRLNCNSLQHWRCCFHRSLSMFLKWILISERLIGLKRSR